jgi:hypothetical protein
MALCAAAMGLHFDALDKFLSTPGVVRCWQLYFLELVRVMSSVLGGIGHDRC